MYPWQKRGLDLVAILVLFSFGWTVRHTRAGAADPTWTDIERRGILRVGTDPGFRPFAEQQGEQWQGYDIDLANELGSRLGLRVRFQPVGYDALYDTLASGDVDLLASALPLAPEQGWRARFSQPYLDAGQVLVVAEASGLHNEGDLAGKIVGAALGSDGDTLLRALHHNQPTIRVQSSYETPDAALRALQRD